MAFKGPTEAVRSSRLGQAFGNVWYVDGTGGSATGSGEAPDAAMTTPELALAASAAGDTIVVAPGTYTIDVGAAALAPLANQRWMAGLPSYGGAPNVVFTADADDTAVPIVSVDVDGVIFEGIEFKMISAAATHIQLLDAAQTTAVRGLAFIDCWFNLNDQDDAGLLGLAFNDATNAIVGLVMRGCRFTGNDATTTAAVAYIEVGAGGIPGALIENCVFEMEGIDGDNLAFNFVDPAAPNKSYGMVIRGNDFIGAQDGGADTVPIFFAAAMTDDEIMGMIRGNFFSGCAAPPITTDKMSNSVIRNFITNTSGGTLVDASA